MKKPFRTFFVLFSPSGWLLANPEDGNAATPLNLSIGLDRRLWLDALILFFSDVLLPTQDAWSFPWENRICCG